MPASAIKLKDRLFSKMLVFFILIVVVPAIFIVVLASKMFLDRLVEQASESYSVSINNLQNALEEELFETKMSAYYMYLDLDLKEAVEAYNQNKNDKSFSELIVQEKFNNYKISASFSNVNIVRVYGFNGFQLSFGESYHLNNLDDSMVINCKWYSDALHDSNDFIWTGLRDTFNLEGSDKSLSIFRVLKDRSYTQDIGMLYINFDARIFSALADSFNFNEASQIYILDNNNVTVSSRPTPMEIIRMVEEHGASRKNNYSITIDANKNEKIFINYLSEYDWKIVGVLPVEEITAKTASVFYYIVLTFIIFLVIASLVWFIILLRIMAPVKKLTRATEVIRTGDFSVRVDHQSKDELGILTNSFNFMISKISSLLQEVVDENNRKKDAEYRALQAQINPHFLYNTLNSIRWMAIIQKADNIKNVVDVLARLLKNSTGKMEQFISVDEELCTLEDYIYIQKIAYNNKFSVEYNIDDEVRNCRCLKFILQPLVENAIFHGILPKETYGTIWVSVFSDSKHLVLSVRDDGVGLDREDADRMIPHEEKSLNNLNSIGIAGVRERLYLAYEGLNEFSIESEKDCFTVITIKIPIEAASKKGHSKC